ncbi:hypothetical protein [Herbiconiux sp.]|uniref:hypothetical protein n=1 Tax=Herbiconiux sp. TaxID=1871186 RepID=UPI0025C03096|nr:hypothetical protein [Herbiconiux sp.]
MNRSKLGIVTVKNTELIVGVPDQLERTARLIAAARGEDINAVVCTTLREYVGAVPL